MGSARWRNRFALHESTQRGLCRLGFFLFALLPFLALVLYSAILATPTYQQYQLHAWEARLSANLGVDVRLGKFQLTAPQQFHASQIVCIHPETRREILKVEELDGLMTPRGWSIVLHKPEVNGDELQSALQVVHDWFLCRPQRSAQIVAATVRGGLVIHRGELASRLSDVEIMLNPSERSSAAQLRFAYEGQPFAERAVIKIERQHSVTNPLTVCEFDSPSFAVPCEIIASRFPMVRNLGDDARFTGNVLFSLSQTGWDARVSGTFTQVDWSKLTQPIGSPLKSAGSLVVRDANLADGRLLQANGEIHAKSGTASMLWIQTICGEFQLPHNLQNVATSTIQVEQIRCRYQLSPEGLSISGLIDPPTGWPSRVAASFAHAPTGAMLGICGSGQEQKVSIAKLAEWLCWNRPTTHDALNGIVRDDFSAFLTTALPWPSGVRTATTSAVTSR